MITEKFMDAIFSVIEFCFGLLPTVSFGWLDKISWVLGQIGKFVSTSSYFLPMGDLLAILGAVLVVANFQVILWFVNWVIRRIADIIP